jgi:hypothetical protein
VSYELNLSDLGSIGASGGLCECDNEPPGRIKCGEYFD